MFVFIRRIYRNIRIWYIHRLAPWKVCVQYVSCELCILYMCSVATMYEHEYENNNCRKRILEITRREIPKIIRYTQHLNPCH